MSAPSRARSRLHGLFLGLISGTSMDVIDAALVDIDGDRIDTIGSLTTAYPASLRHRLFAAILPKTRLSVHEFATLDIEVGQAFAFSASALLAAAHIPAARVIAIGSHGQTLRHAPLAAVPYSMQIGSAATIAARLGITTVADFRALDIAYGGHGAPLVPAFHAWTMGSRTANRAVVNIGGIANITLLPAATNAPLIGYDTGPGNCLMDAWCALKRAQAYDLDGRWAASGTPIPALLAALLADPYYLAPPPKSSGREVFNLGYLERLLGRAEFAGLLVF